MRAVSWLQMIKRRRRRYSAGVKRPDSVTSIHTTRFPSILFLPLCLLFFGVPASASALRAAAVKVDITPQASQWLLGYNARHSTGVHDRIFHRILAINDGETTFYLIASDLCLFSPSVYDEVAAQLTNE